MEKEILKIITTKKIYKKRFSHIIKGFENKIVVHDPIQNCFEIEKYFGAGTGRVSATKRLIKDGKVKESWIEEYITKKGNVKRDFKGLYVFINGNTPIYVGISKGVIGRIFQHVKGHNHNTSTLAYNIGLHRYEMLNGKPHTGSRKDFNFKSEVEPIKRFLIKQKISFIPIDNNEELHLFEIYCAMKLQCALNKFETH